MSACCEQGWKRGGYCLRGHGSGHESDGYDRGFRTITISQAPQLIDGRGLNLPLQLEAEGSHGCTHLWWHVRQRLRNRITDSARDVRSDRTRIVSSFQYLDAKERGQILGLEDCDLSDVILGLNHGELTPANP